ncbi:MAG: trypsin-like serine protease [Clostridiaceae bacterium]|nr:trypsin-like serine protease [Clostridiaceae bacterium]
MDEKNLYHNDNTENAFEQAARQQAALQEEQAQLREAQPLMKEEIISPQPILKEESVPPQPVQEPVMEAETQPSVVQPETRTPYQIPVRDSREVPQDQAQPDSSIPPQGERVQPPYHAPQSPYYVPHPPKKKGKTGKRIVIAVGGIAAAAALFFGGAAIGSAMGDFDSRSGSGSSGSSHSQIQTVPSAITIAQTPKGMESIPGDVIYERVNPSVVSITATSLTSNGGSLGSGIVMSEDGYIVTNHHVTEGMDKFVVMLSDGSELNASLVAGDADTDVAVLKAETNGRKLTVPEFGDSDSLKPGEAAYAIGTPTAYRLTNTITTGSISAINRNITINDKVMTLIQTDAAINSGNSGGALVNKYGQVVGITNAKLSSNVFSSSASYEGLGFAIPINTAKEIVDELMANGYVAGRPSIGISGSEISEETAKYNDVPQGVLIQSIDSRAKAYGKGLEIRDIITGINGKTITTMDEINEVKNRFKAGETVTLTIYRMSTGKSLDIEVELTDAHDLEGADPAKVKIDQADNSGSSSGKGGGNGYYSFPFGNFFGW